MFEEISKMKLVIKAQVNMNSNITININGIEFRTCPTKAHIKSADAGAHALVYIFISVCQKIWSVYVILTNNATTNEQQL